jgi:hypothetical protein
MQTDWIYQLKNVEGERNYEIRFYKGDSIHVSAKDAAKVKFAILNEIKCFEIKDSLYATASIAGVIKGKNPVTYVTDVEYDEFNPPKEQIEAQKRYYASLNMNSYLSDGKLLDKPILLLENKS